MILDGHIHTREGAENRADFLRRLGEAGVGGGIVISYPPPTSQRVTHSASPLDRMNNVLSWCAAAEDLYPFYWIDPLEDDAAEQIAMAVDKGTKGFKVICNRYYPGDKRALKVFTAIAEVNRPILFHSGILWDGKPSSPYNHPSGFEVLLEIKGLRFCLAHISWPWCDEAIAVYGKFLNAYTENPDLSVEMFIDITPGTPPIYRREALTKLFTVGYDVENNVIFGSDSYVNEYNVGWVQSWIDRDKKIFRELELDEQTIDRIYAGNLKRFVGVSSANASRIPLRPGE